MKTVRGRFRQLAAEFLKIPSADRRRAFCGAGVSPVRRQIRPHRRCRPTPVLFAVCASLWIATCATGPVRERLAADESIPGIRRVRVPFNRPDLWPDGDWQPIPLAELERQLDRAAAGRSRPRPFIERAEYSATLVNGQWQDARADWQIARPDAFQSLLVLGQMNLNVSHLAWSAAESNATPSKARTVPALWATTPDGRTGIIVDRREGRLVGEW